MAVASPIISLKQKPEPLVLIKRYCRHRGCVSNEEVNEFRAARPTIRNPYGLIPDVQVAIDRILVAIREKQKICVFGDFDADGITSTVQMLDFLESHGADVDFFIPNRAKHNYGLTIEAIDDCLASKNFDLFIVLDCGSTRIDSTDYLQSKGIDSLIIDHHDIPESQGAHSAVAHLNPKAWDGLIDGIDDLLEMSAAGLVYLFTAEFNEQVPSPTWNQDRAVILAGIGSMVDVMPLTKINRALVKNSLFKVNDRTCLKNFPGMDAIIEVAKLNRGKGLGGHSYGFVIGPMLNATGRMDSASISVKALRSITFEEGLKYAEILHEQNTLRKNLQKQILDQAIEQAESLLIDDPNLPLIVVHNKEWHAGIVGIVAGRLKELYERPTFVLGWNKDEEKWKGSGRSVEGCDLGRAVHQAFDAGAIVSGGGHPMAAGISVAEGGISHFVNYMIQNIGFDPEKYNPVVEIMGHMTWSSISNWANLFSMLEPFGNGNPRPYLLIENARVINYPIALRKRVTGEIWGYRVSLSIPSPTGSNDSRHEAVTITDARQLSHFEPDATLSLSVSASVSNSGNKSYENLNLHKIH